MPRLDSWHPIPPSSHFSLLNLPFGIISTPPSNPSPRPAIAIGLHALDLSVFTSAGGFSSLLPSPNPLLAPLTSSVLLSAFSQPSLNTFASLGRPTHRLIRSYIQSLFLQDTPHPHILKDNPSLRAECLIPLVTVRMHVPMQVGDYTDFYAGKHHAVNCGRLFRQEGRELHENYTTMPVGYHGRASSVVVSGTGIRRPRGQVKRAEGNGSEFSESRRLDFELELGAFVCKESVMGEGGLSVEEADQEGIFGLVLLNDWSARDVQMWEYVPLGPFNGKNFGTSVSAWVVLVDALEGFRTKGLGADEDDGGRELLPYLKEARRDGVFDIRLEVDLMPKGKPPTTILRSNGKNLLFSFPQMLAHHSVGGCPMRVGDLLGSGTISGPDQGSEGSLLEASKGGKMIVKLDGGEERTFLEDGDTVILRGVCGTEEDGLVGFGECVGQILPAVNI